MGKRQSYIVNGELFRSKKDLEERVRSIVDRYQDREILNLQDYQFMLDLLNHHPSAENKIGCGVVSIYVARNPVYTNTRTFYVIRSDKSETDFSWPECLKPTPKNKKVISACRALIEPYIIEFKQKFFDRYGGEAICEITSQTISFIGSHVDHKPPNTFQVLFDSFVNQHEINLESVELKAEWEDNKYQDELADEKLGKLWIEYHNKNAVLRVISAEANLSHVKISNNKIIAKSGLFHSYQSTSD